MRLNLKPIFLIWNIVIKPADKERAVVTTSIGHYQSMIMQYLLDKNTCKNKTLASTTKYKVIFHDF